MPTFRIETNRGTFEIDSNREPTATEIEEFISKDAAAPAPSPVTAPAQTNPLTGRAMRPEIAQALNPANLDRQMAKAGTGAARAAPIVATMLAPPVGMAGWLGIGALGGAG